MAINCEQLQDQYSDYFEHSLSDADVDTFERHLAGCDSCRSDYHTFATMFQFLDRIEVAEVDPPSDLRADILTAIAQRNTPKQFSMLDWLAGVFSTPQVVWGAGLAAAACVVLGIALTVHFPNSANNGTSSTVTAGEGLGSSPISTAGPAPLLQNVVLKEGADNMDYVVFTLHMPPSMSSAANVSAYVLQDGGPVADQSMESDTNKATPAWSGSIEPNVSLTLPVAVTSDLPAGTSLNLLLDWTSKDGTTSGREVAFVPITAASSNPTQVTAGSSFYDAVRTIAGEYQQTIVADSSALAAVPNVNSLSGSTGNELNAEQALQSVLSTDGFTIKVQPGGYYLISHP